MQTEPRRILIVRPSALGDVARTVPALVSLKRAYPNTPVDWLVNDAFADAIRHHPDLDCAIEFPRKKFSRFGMSLSVTRQAARYFRDLRGRGYDTVYDLQGLGRSGWLTWVTGAARRVGPSDARELAWLAYNKRVRVRPDCPQTVDRMLAVLEGDGVQPVRDMRLYVGQEDRAWAQQLFHSLGLDPATSAVVAPTAAWVSKRWPVERYDALIQRLGEWGVSDCVIVGSASERASVASLLQTPRAGPRRHDLIGKTTVGQLMAVMEHASLVIANDSAALHLAVGLGRRCVGLFGPTDPEKVGPYRYPQAVVAAARPEGINYRAVKNDQSLIAGITLEQAMEGIHRVMQAPPPQTMYDESDRTGFTPCA